jgi:serine phosphatase RsbU (regulator of sigma subunit)
MATQVPVADLPDGWVVESCQVPAAGETSTGDVVRGVVRDGVLDLVLADVSGHGDAVRAPAARLGAMLDDLLATTPSAGLLAALTAQLYAEEWGGNFATAVHLRVDLGTGELAVRGAGHPPPVRRKAASGRWRLLDCSGPVLGLLPTADHQPATEHLDRGDAVLIYTDGLVEHRHRNIERGIVGMLRAAEEEYATGADGLTGRLLARVGLPDDDRALVLVQRR